MSKTAKKTATPIEAKVIRLLEEQIQLCVLQREEAAQRILASPLRAMRALEWGAGLAEVAFMEQQMRELLSAVQDEHSPVPLVSALGYLRDQLTDSLLRNEHTSASSQGFRAAAQESYAQATVTLRSSVLHWLDQLRG